MRKFVVTTIVHLDGTKAWRIEPNESGFTVWAGRVSVTMGLLTDKPGPSTATQTPLGEALRYDPSVVMPKADPDDDEEIRVGDWRG